MKNCYNVVRDALGKYAPGATPSVATPFPTTHAVLVAQGMSSDEATTAIAEAVNVYQQGVATVYNTWQSLSLKVEAGLGGMLTVSLEYYPGIRKKSELMLVEREDGAVTLRIGDAVNYFTPDDEPSALFIGQVLQGINDMLDDRTFMRLWVEYSVLFGAVYKALCWQTKLPPELQEHIRDARTKIADRFAHA